MIHDPTVISFDSVSACDRQTDRQTDRHACRLSDLGLQCNYFSSSC